MEALFRDLGFSESEIKVYLALADLGGCTAGHLSKRIDIPRTTVYSALESLSVRGLIAKEEKGGITRFLANPPSSIVRMMKREREDIERKVKHAEELSKQLSPLFLGKSFQVPRLQYFDGRRNVEAMLEEYTPIWRESIYQGDSTWWGYQDASFVPEYREWLERAWKSMSPTEKINLVSNQGPHERELSGRVRGREIRSLGEELEFSSTVWILGEYIVMISSREKPHYAFQIRDKAFSQNQRAIFRALWSRVK